MKTKIPEIGLKASYYLPLVSALELAAIIVIIAVPVVSKAVKPILLLSLLSAPLNNLEPMLVGITVAITVAWLSTLLVTVDYQRGNGFHNYFISWSQTGGLRDTSKIQPKISQVKQDNKWQEQKIIDPDERAFNEAVRNWYVDRRQDKLTVWLLIPTTAGAQAIFDQRLTTIDDNIRHANPGYVFSPAERNGNYYVISAIKM